MSTSDPHEYADDADLAEQRTPVGEEEELDLRGRDDADEADLFEQAIPVPEDEDDHRD